MTHFRLPGRPAGHAQTRQLRPRLTRVQPSFSEAQRLRHPFANDLVDRRLRAAR